ncbi:hypothetical protein X975_18340, partial [Stegodyphus mimosarum]
MPVDTSIIIIASFFVGVCCSGYDILCAVILILIGVYLGYKLKGWRLRRLRQRRGELIRDLRRVRNEMNDQREVNS